MPAIEPHCRIGRWTPKRYSRSRVNSLFASKTNELRRSVEAKALRDAVQRGMK